MLRGHGAGDLTWIKRWAGRERDTVVIGQFCPSIEQLTMMNRIFRHVAPATVLALAAGCASVAPADRPRTNAILTSGGVVSYTAASESGPRVSVAEIDGRPVDRPYGPLELAPGKHAVTLKCGNSVTTNIVTVAAGEVYQFNAAAGAKGCIGSLSRLPPSRT
jgi:hypothetical protein